MSDDPERRQPEPEEDDDLLLDSPIMKLAVIVWTVGVFAIAILLADRGYIGWGLAVLLLGAAVGLFAFWEPLRELWRWLRRRQE